MLFFLEWCVLCCVLQLQSLWSTWPNPSSCQFCFVFSSIILNSFAFKICEKVTGRPEVPKQQGELQVANVFCFLLFSPSLLIKQVLPKTNFFFFFLFSNLGLIMAQQGSIHGNCFTARNDTPCAILSQKCILWEGRLVKLPSPLRYFFYLIRSSLTDIKCLAKN